MHRSGHGTFVSPSAQPYGKLHLFDRIQRMDKCIQAILGAPEVIAFSTIKASTIDGFTSGGMDYISRWDPINPTKINQHMTQSSAANMPVFLPTTTTSQGKYPLVRGIGDDSLEQVDTCFDTAAKDSILIVSYRVFTGSTDPSNYLFSLNWGPDYDPYRNGFKSSTTTTTITTQSLDLASVQSDGTTIKSAGVSGAGANLNTLNTFWTRMVDLNIDTTIRTGSVAFYGAGFDLKQAFTIRTRTGSVGPAYGPTTVPGSVYGSNSSTFLFTTSSLATGGASDAEWDYMFDGGIKPSKIKILKNMGDMAINGIFYVKGAVITPNQMNFFFYNYYRMIRFRALPGGVG